MSRKGGCCLVPTTPERDDKVLSSVKEQLSPADVVDGSRECCAGVRRDVMSLAQLAKPAVR